MATRATPSSWIHVCMMSYTRATPSSWIHVCMMSYPWPQGPRPAVEYMCAWCLTHGHAQQLNTCAHDVLPMATPSSWIHVCMMSYPWPQGPRPAVEYMCAWCLTHGHAQQLNTCMHDVLPMATRVDEVETTVNSMVFYIPSIETRFISQILVVFLIHIVNDGLPTTIMVYTHPQCDTPTPDWCLPSSIVHCISKPRCIHDSKPQFYPLLLNIHSSSIYAYCLLDSLYTRTHTHTWTTCCNTFFTSYALQVGWSCLQKS